MHRLFSLAAAMTWAISPAWLSQVLAIANREGAGPEAVAKELGRPLDNTRAVEMRGNIAVIPVTGPIFRRANMLTEVSGATSIAILAQDFNAALANDDVDGIVLEIDSPGGEVSGVSEFAEMIYAARGAKPCVAYVGGDGCSAAYWIASACDHVVISDTAIVGSIGVVRAIPDPRAKTARDIEIVSSQSPNKRPNVRTEEGRAVFQAEVDALADVFVERVARNRGVSVDTVLEEFGQGGCFVGARAVAAGMADAVGSLENVIASFVRKGDAKQSKRAASASAPVTLPITLNVEVTSEKELRAMSKNVAAVIAATALAASAGPVAAEDDDDKEKEKDNAEDAPADESSGPAFEVGDAVTVGDRSAKVTEVRNGPHYAVEFDDDGSAFQWASEDELAGDAPADDSEPGAEDDDKDESPAAIRARALAAENRKLRAQLLGTKREANKNGVEALVARAKTEKKLTPALEKEIRNVAKISLPAASALVSALPRIAPLASVKTAPSRKNGAAPMDLSFNGKKYGALSWAEKHELASSNKDLFDQMREAHEAEARDMAATTG